MNMYQCNRSPQGVPLPSTLSRLVLISLGCTGCIYGNVGWGAPKALSCVVHLVHPLMMQAHTALLLAEVLCFAKL